MPPPTGYLNVAGIDGVVGYLISTFPALCQPVPLPETTSGGLPIRAVRIRAGEGSRNGLLLIGGTHSNETINPDLLVRFALHLCHAYTLGTGLTYGDKEWSVTDIRAVLSGTDLFIIPQLNPDGREYVFSPTGDRWWRMNRSDNADTECIGTDLNRNYGFLWKWTIGNTSANPCDLLMRYRGDAAFSEPETRNVRWLLNSFPDIVGLVDLHSYRELLLYPWGDDDNQTKDASQNFRNQIWDGQRGSLGTGYAEYIPPADEARFISLGSRVRAAIAAVRGRSYTLQQAAKLYPTSGTSKDYSYSRYFAGGLRGRTKVWAWSFETNTGNPNGAYGFQPPYEDAIEVMDEVSSGLIQLALSTVCLVREVGKSILTDANLVSLQEFRNSVMRGTPKGERWTSLLEAHGEEVLAMVGRDKELRVLAERAIRAAADVVLSADSDKPAVLDRRAAEPMRRLLDAVIARGSPALARAGKGLSRDLEQSIGKTAVRALGRKRREPPPPPVVRPNPEDLTDADGAESENS